MKYPSLNRPNLSIAEEIFAVDYLVVLVLLPDNGMLLVNPGMLN